ncbi:MAG: FG-GAP repeat domain-containing protein [Byssovorax sp.]
MSPRDGPWRLATGDVNSDGRDDFVTFNGLDSSLTVRGRTATGFEAAQTYPAGDFEGGVQLVDCDNDGDLDLLYTSGSEASAALSVRKNNGTGTFGAATSTSLGTGLGSTSALTVGDWNGDGAKDVVVSVSNHAIVRLLGTGSCNFGSKVSGATQPNPMRIYNADMDKDGNLDLVIAHFLQSKISIYLGHGDGNFSSPTVLSMADAVNDLAIGDFNGDASPDIVFIGNEGTYLLGSNP